MNNMFVFFCLFLSTGYACFSQNKCLELRCLKPSALAEREFEQLLKKEEKCADYDTSLIWSIQITQKESEIRLFISMKSQINTDHSYSGCFLLGNTIFLVTGMNDSLLPAIGIKKICFNKKQIYDDQRSPELEDYSSWDYAVKKDSLVLLNSYVLPCGK